MATSNAFIGRRRAVGLGKEVTPGTAVSASVWIPIMDLTFKPVTEKITDDSGQGNIYEVLDQQTVKNWTEISFGGIVRDVWVGNLMSACFSTAYLTYEFVMSGIVGTFVNGEVVTGGTSGATGTVRHISGTVAYGDLMYIEVIAGTFTAAGETITGGTSGATGTIAYDAVVFDHVFTIKNDNCHNSYTLYNSDPIATVRAPYCMLDTLSLENVAADFAKLTASFMGKIQEATVATPAYTDENTFTACDAQVFFADTLALMPGTTATSLSAYKIDFAKNLTDFQALGNCDIASFHNQQFGITGDMEALFEDEVLRNYVINSTKKAMRYQAKNTDVTIGTAANPTLTIEFARGSFQDWDSTTDSNALLRQTLGYTVEYSSTDGFAAVAVLKNTNGTAY